MYFTSSKAYNNLIHFCQNVPYVLTYGTLATMAHAIEINYLFYFPLFNLTGSFLPFFHFIHKILIDYQVIIYQD